MLGTLGGSTLSDEVRLAGLVLQLLGIGQVWTDLAQLGRLFGRPSIVTRWRAIAAAVSSPIQRAEARVTLGEIRSVGRATAKVISTSQDPMHRIAVIEQQLELDRANADARFVELGGALRALSGTVDERVTALRNDLTGARGLVDAAVAGDLGLRWVGAFWLCLATVASTAPDEIVGCIEQASAWWGRG